MPSRKGKQIAAGCQHGIDGPNCIALLYKFLFPSHNRFLGHNLLPCKPGKAPYIPQILLAGCCALFLPNPISRKFPNMCVVQYSFFRLCFLLRVDVFIAPNTCDMEENPQKIMLKIKNPHTCHSASMRMIFHTLHLPGLGDGSLEIQFIQLSALPNSRYRQTATVYTARR